MAGEYKLKVNNPARPKDDLIEVQPFGHVENGSSITVFLTKQEVARIEESPILELDSTGRKKSSMNDDDKSRLEQAESLEAQQEAEREALEDIAEDTPIAGDESVDATEPVEPGEEG